MFKIIINRDDGQRFFHWREDSVYYNKEQNMKNAEIPLTVYDGEDAGIVIANIKRVFFEAWYRA